MDVDKLLGVRLPEEDVEIPDVGTVRVRALSRREILAAQRQPEGDRESYIVSRAMVDPPMTVRQVVAWQECSPAGEMEPVTLVIERLSGLKKGQDKEIMAQFPDGPGDGV